MILRKKIIFFIIAILTIASVFILLQKPSHNRDWELGHEKLTQVKIVGNEIQIENFRDFIWNGELSAQNNYVTKNFKLSEIEKTEFIVSHFSDFEGIAHAFLSFIFSNGDKIIMSMETRRDGGEEFSPTLGLLRKFETIYVLGSESDIIGVRNDFRDERIYVYPTIFSKEDSQKLFLEVAKEINSIYEKPKFYNTLWNNCMNAITRPIENISNFNFPFTYKILLPGFMDEVFYEMGIIPRLEGKNFSETKEYYLFKNF